ncbi:MAG TPA: hypothetical protein VFZ69_08195 [Longimicrobiales bacterium]
MRRRIGGQFVLAESGAAVSLRSGRGPRILIAVHGVDCAACAAWTARLAADRAPLDEWGARLTVVAEDTGRTAAAELRAAVVQLLLTPDPASALGVHVPALVIADEWGEVYFSVHAGDGHDFPDPAEVIEWIRFIAIQCPECEQPEGEWRALP